MTERTPQGWIAPKRPRPKGPDDSQEDFFPDTLPAKPVVEPEKDLFQAADEAEEERDRALVDQLIADTQLYDSAQAIKELLEFTVRLRHCPDGRNLPAAPEKRTKKPTLRIGAFSVGA